MLSLSLSLSLSQPDVWSINWTIRLPADWNMQPVEMTRLEMAENHTAFMDSKTVFQVYLDKTIPTLPAMDHDE